jgi:frataxin-like iron-binding protein CyaY
MNENEFNKFYDAYKEYADKKIKDKSKNYIFDFDMDQPKDELANKRNQKKQEQEVNFKLSFGIKASDKFIDKMDHGLDRIQKALDNLRNELYLYPEF